MLMKTTSRSLLLLFALIAITLFSCEPIDDPNTENDRDKFLGSWTCNETNRKVPAYWVEINENPIFSSQVSISNFGQLGDEAKPSATVSGDNISVPNQFCLDDTYEVEGEGVMISDDSVDWEFTLNDGSTLLQITAVYSRND